MGHNFLRNGGGGGAWAVSKTKYCPLSSYKTILLAMLLSKLHRNLRQQDCCTAKKLAGVIFDDLVANVRFRNISGF